MEITILIGLYGSGKSTILKNLKNIEIEKISLDELDKESRANEKRIKIIFELFQQYLKKNIDLKGFQIDYLNIINLQNNSLINTLSILFSKYSSKLIDESIKNDLRKKILIPSILKYFLIIIRNLKINSDVIIDSGAMHFLSMKDSFFKSLGKFFKKINIIYLNNSIEQVIYNLFRKNNNHYSFLERGFKKEIYEKVEKNFGVKIPNNLEEATELIESKENIKNFINNYINKILSLSKKDLDFFINNIDSQNNINLYKININFDDSINKIINNLNKLKIINTKTDSPNLILIKKRPKAIFFDLSSTILDSHKIDLECIDFVLTKYILPKWLEGTNKKKIKINQ